MSGRVVVTPSRWEERRGDTPALFWERVLTGDSTASPVTWPLVEVKGLEPSASTLRKYGSQPLTRPFLTTFLVTTFRSPQAPSRSLPFPLDRDT